MPERLKRIRRLWPQPPASFWQHLCWLALVVLIGSRVLRYALVEPGPGMDHLLGSAMIWAAQSFRWTLAYGFVVAQSLGGLTGLGTGGFVAVIALLALLLVRLLSRREDGLWRFRPLLVSLMYAGMVWLHYLFDANPAVGLACGLSILLLGREPGRTRDRTPRQRWLLRAGWAAFAVACLAAAGDVASRLALIVWGAFLLVAGPRLPRVLGPREVRIALVLAVIPANLLAAVLPIVFPALHGGTRMGDELVYAYCEVPRLGRLYASAPACSSVQVPRDGEPSPCLDGRVLVYDTLTLQRIDELSFFDEGYLGRLEQLVCLDDEIHVAVQATRRHGEDLGQTALSFRLAAPERDFTPVVAGAGVGSTIAYDPRRDAVFYIGEFTHRLARLDRKSGRIEQIDSCAMQRTWSQPFDDARSGSSGALIDPTADRLYLDEYHAGRLAHAIDLETLEEEQTYALNGGGSWGITVDTERGRILSASTWGVVMLDEETGEVLRRRRIGLGGKRVVLDAARDRLYVASSIEGVIRVLDRDTLETLASIPVGFGTRYPHLSADGKWLFASSMAAHFYWDADEIAPGRGERRGGS